MSGVYSINPLLYQKNRPVYQQDLFEFIYRHVNNFDLAWDCATGNGQAVLNLHKKFKKIIASDIDQKQLDFAHDFENVEYHCFAEKIPILENESVDLVTVATAIHWLDQKKFFKESDRVLKKGGILAVWGYDGKSLHQDLDEVLDNIIKDYLDPYYSHHIQIAFDKYRAVEYPYDAIETPDFYVEIEFSYEQLVNYILSWSSSQNYMLKQKKSPLPLFEKMLKSAWGDLNQTKNLKWDIHTYIGRK